MKTNQPLRNLASAVIVGVSIIVAGKSFAAVSGINPVATSYAQIGFNDTNSFDPLLTPGITALTLGTGPWNGATWSMASTTDPVTFDNAQGDITGSVILGNYNIALNNISLTQAPLNTGFAHLNFQFSIEFQLDAFGLASQPTLYPNFLINGTVQNIAGSFAAISGFIDYYGVNTAGTYSVMETVNYNYLNTTPGGFSTTVFGAPVNGTTPNLVPNTTIALVGNIDFIVDPASFTVETVVPEPTSASILALVAIGGLVFRRHSMRA